MATILGVRFDLCHGSQIGDLVPAIRVFVTLSSCECRLTKPNLAESFLILQPDSSLDFLQILFRRAVGLS
jgi:hypothetical protein